MNKEILLKIYKILEQLEGTVALTGSAALSLLELSDSIPKDLDFVIYVPDKEQRGVVMSQLRDTVDTYYNLTESRYENRAAVQFVCEGASIDVFFIDKPRLSFKVDLDGVELNVSNPKSIFEAKFLLDGKKASFHLLNLLNHLSPKK